MGSKHSRCYQLVVTSSAIRNRILHDASFGCHLTGIQLQNSCIQLELACCCWPLSPVRIQHTAAWMHCTAAWVMLQAISCCTLSAFVSTMHHLFSKLLPNRSLSIIIIAPLVWWTHCRRAKFHCSLWKHNFSFFFMVNSQHRFSHFHLYTTSHTRQSDSSSWMKHKQQWQTWCYSAAMLWCWAIPQKCDTIWLFPQINW